MTRYSANVAHPPIPKIAAVCHMRSSNEAPSSLHALRNATGAITTTVAMTRIAGTRIGHYSARDKAVSSSSVKLIYVARWTMIRTRSQRSAVLVEHTDSPGCGLGRHSRGIEVETDGHRLRHRFRQLHLELRPSGDVHERTGWLGSMR